MIHRSHEQTPGTVVLFRDGTTAILNERKADGSGWWCGEQGGLADYVLDGPGWAVPTQDDLQDLFEQIKARAGTTPGDNHD